MYFFNKSNKEEYLLLYEKIKDKLQDYFKTLEGEKITFKGSAIPRKGIYSRIYTFKVLSYKKGLVDTIIAKVFFENKNINQAVVSKSQYETLKELQLRFEETPSFSIPLSLDYFPDMNTIIMKKLNGITLHSMIEKSSLLFIKHKSLTSYCEKSGEWLKFFHNIFENKKEDYLPVGRLITEIEEILKQIYLGRDTNNRILSNMEYLGNKIAKIPTDIRLSHGDYKPDNIIILKDSIGVIDIHCEKEESIYIDIAKFITSMSLISTKNIFSHINDKLINECNLNFLKGYFKNDKFSNEIIQFLQLRGLIRQLFFSFKRIKNPILRRYIISFYTNKMKSFMEDIEGKRF